MYPSNPPGGDLASNPSAARSSIIPRRVPDSCIPFTLRSTVSRAVYIPFLVVFLSTIVLVTVSRVNFFQGRGMN